MRYYCQLQYLILKRTIEASGIPFLLGVGLFIVGYVLLFYGVGRLPNYGVFILPFMQQAALMPLCHADRTDYLKQLFSARDYGLIRGMEILMVTLPLLVISIFQSAGWVSLILCVLPILTSMINSRSSRARALPTPFSRQPFEFIQLFRQMWILLLLLLLLLAIALYYKNENLSRVIIGFSILLGLRAYEEVEPDWYVWNYAQSPTSFLLMKWRRAIGHLSVWLMPAMLMHLLFQPAAFISLVLLWIGGVLLLLLTILMKYSVYPDKPGLSEVVLLVTAGISLIGIPYLYVHFYRKSIRQLKNLLC